MLAIAQTEWRRVEPVQLKQRWQVKWTRGFWRKEYHVPIVQELWEQVHMDKVIKREFRDIHVDEDYYPEDFER